jgi:RNA polymerase sigma-70 factor, ECF subfamily
MVEVSSSKQGLAGNSPGIEHAWQHLRSELRGFVASRVASSSIADDLLQDVFLRVQRNKAELDRVSNLRAWIFRITRNVLTDHHRTQARRKPEALHEALPDDSIDWGKQIREKLAPCLRVMIDELPAIYRDALRLVELEEMSQALAAKELRISLTALKSRVRRGRALLKNLLLECCHFEVTAGGKVVDYWPRACCAGESSKLRNCS